MPIKQIANNLLRALPDNGRAVRRFYRRLVDARRHQEVRRRQEEGNWRLPPPDAVLHIPPGRIRLLTNYQPAGPAREAISRAFPVDWRQPVVGGDWDRGGIPFAGIEACKAIRDRIRDGTPWQETGYWRESLAFIEAGREVRGCRTAGDLAQRFAYVDALIASIRQHGLLPHDQVGAVQDPTGRVTGDIEVNIGRDGEFLFQDGRHRLAIALELDLESVPVRVKVRHEEWQKFREYMFTMVAGGGGAAKDGVLYQSPLHPDLREIPAEHSCEDRLAQLLPHLRVRSGRLLDIGCNLGFFCSGFEQAGLECVGVEYGPDIAYATNRIAVAEGRRYRALNGDILDPRVHDPIVAQPFDVVLALNIFHHFMKTREDHERLIVLLRKLRPRQAFFEPHRVDEGPMQGAYRNLPPGEFVAFVQEHMQLPHAEHIGTAPDGRSIFSLYR